MLYRVFDQTKKQAANSWQIHGKFIAPISQNLSSLVNLLPGRPKICCGQTNWGVGATKAVSSGSSGVVSWSFQGVNQVLLSSVLMYIIVALMLKNVHDLSKQSWYRKACTRYQDYLVQTLYSMVTQSVIKCWYRKPCRRYQESPISHTALSICLMGGRCFSGTSNSSPWYLYNIKA